MKRLLHGAVAGLAATFAMSAVVFGGKAFGLLTTPPPEEITARVGEQAGVQPQRHSKAAFHLTWVAAHLGFGMASGVAYIVVRRLLPGRVVLPGLIYGALVWCFGYLGVMPALELYPWPSEDSDSRKSVMLLAHAVYGVTVAGIARDS